MNMEMGLLLLTVLEAGDCRLGQRVLADMMGFSLGKTNALNRKGF